MNIAKLFETQRVLRDRIGYNEPDRFEKLILALLVEIGECANEYRAWKFWSKNQKSNLIDVVLKSEYRKKHNVTEGFTKSGTRRLILDDIEIPFTKIDEFYEIKNPLLEEYVDGLHFVLEIGLEIDDIEFRPIRLISLTNNITTHFTSIFKIASELDLSMLLIDSKKYHTLFNNYLLLGEMLGFTWEEIETAYYSKNQVNHERQSNGY